VGILPTGRPRIGVADIIRLYDPFRGNFALIGIRGYYRDTMGEPGKNDRGIYDDAIIACWPETPSTTGFRAFNANVDPTAKFRPGLASLKTGIWKYRLGIHGLNRPKDKRYEALVQADMVTVLRDGQAADTGFFGVNIHRGGYGTTSSLGCQTIYPAQWDEFIALVKGKMTAAGQAVVRYHLTDF
jgi:hypothetical protein